MYIQEIGKEIKKREKVKCFGQNKNKNIQVIGVRIIQKEQGYKDGKKILES